MKIGGCWRSVRTHPPYLGTARNHGIHPMGALRDAMAGNPWMPPQTPSSITGLNGYLRFTSYVGEQQRSRNPCRAPRSPSARETLKPSMMLPSLTKKRDTPSEGASAQRRRLTGSGRQAGCLNRGPNGKFCRHRRDGGGRADAPRRIRGLSHTAPGGGHKGVEAGTWLAALKLEREAVRRDGPVVVNWCPGSLLHHPFRSKPPVWLAVP
jgi:hypothetical protein